VVPTPGPQRGAPFAPPGPEGRSPASQLLWGAATSCHPSRRASYASLGDTTVLPPVRPHQLAARELWIILESVSRNSNRQPRWRRQGLPSPRGTRLIIRQCSSTPAGSGGLSGPRVSCLTRPPPVSTTSEAPHSSRYHSRESDASQRRAFAIWAAAPAASVSTAASTLRIAQHPVGLRDFEISSGRNASTHWGLSRWPAKGPDRNSALCGTLCCGHKTKECARRDGDGPLTRGDRQSF
jgi:hypothetical protein